MTTYSEQPDIMAIGDSMYQGIRSLSLLPAMVQHSAPKQVADAIGMAMTVPDLRQPLLFDLEAELRRGGLLNLVEHIRGVCLENLKSWPPDQPWSQHEAFDNIAVGGAQIASLFEDTYDKYVGQARDLSAKLAGPALPLRDLATTIGDLWFALNNCYTLNPRHRNEPRGKSQLDQVADRQPQILLINIGSNEGLFMAGFAGDFSDQTLARVATIPELLKPVAERLKALPERVERIVFNGLIRPRFIPNLMPSPEHENDFPGDGYYDAYGTRIGSTQTALSGAKIRAFDELIADVNARSQGMLKAALGNRVAFADVYAACPPFDGKHYRSRGLAIPGRATTLSNKPITPVPFGFFGGFAGLDNMHPTIPGYAVIADVVLAALGRGSVQTDKAAAYAADTLLNNVRGLPLLIAEIELSLLGAFGVFRGSGTAPATV
jgi:lysophospholipase L1-like esterase